MLTYIKHTENKNGNFITNEQPHKIGQNITKQFT